MTTTPNRFVVSAVFTILVLTAAGTVACGKTSSTATPSLSTQTTSTQTTSSSSSLSFSKDIQPIFDANCVICHQGSSGPAGLSLQSNASYSNLVNAKSTESQLTRVNPGNPDKSYLLNKLLGTQNQVGGTGAQMPFGASPLSQSQINLIQQWIQQGAPNN